MSVIRRYTHWLHTRWPAGTVEKLPDMREDGTTAVPGVRIVGDLTGVPLLKFSSARWLWPLKVWFARRETSTSSSHRTLRMSSG